MDKSTDQMFDETFKDSKGLPEVEHKKKLIKKEAETRRLLAKLNETYYTFRGGKLLKLMATPRGAKSVYIGREKTIGKKDTLAIIAKWKKDGVFLEYHECKEVLGKKIKELAKAEDDILKKKNGART